MEEDAPVMIRKRGAPMSGPMRDMLGETALFCLDFVFNQLTDGARMYRLHDYILVLRCREDLRQGLEGHK